MVSPPQSSISQVPPSNASNDIDALADTIDTNRYLHIKIQAPKITPL